MSTLAYDNLPDVQRSVKARPLFAMRLSVRPLQVVGETPVGVRRIGVVFGGVFEGGRLSGEVLDVAVTGRSCALTACSRSTSAWC